jgi:hypothetical protein
MEDGARHTQERDLAADIEADLAAQRESLRRLRKQVAALTFEIKFRRLLRKAGYNPDQPRVLAGNPDGGQWTNGSGSAGQSRLRLAGEIPTNDPPDIPKTRPSTAKKRAQVLREAGKWLAKIAKVGGRIDTFITILEGISWIRDQIPNILAYRDLSKSLEELQEAVSVTSIPGYQDHHIVEQGSARSDGFPDSMIESSDNIVPIPTLKHRQINGWYQTSNKDYGGLSPREWLRGKDWDVRREMGLDALVDHEVLKP